MVYNVYEKKDPISGATKPGGRGRSSTKSISEEDRNRIIDHIKSFPVVDSHYCLAKTNKQYLESGLSIEKMYNLYEEKAAKEGYIALKSSYYRHVFNTNFNISFHKV